MSRFDDLFGRGLMFKSCPLQEHSKALCMPVWHVSVSTYWGRDKMATILQIFSNPILKWNHCIFIQMLLMLFFQAPNQQWVSLVQLMAWCCTRDKPLPEPLPEPMINRFSDAYMRHSLSLTHWSLNKWLIFCRRYFGMHFLEPKFHINQNVIELFFIRVQWINFCSSPSHYFYQWSSSILTELRNWGREPFSRRPFQTRFLFENCILKLFPMVQ